jgi:hypothetical protein
MGKQGLVTDLFGADERQLHPATLKGEQAQPAGIQSLLLPAKSMYHVVQIKSLANSTRAREVTIGLALPLVVRVGHSDNYIEANPVVTAVHLVVTEWYFAFEKPVDPCLLSKRNTTPESYCHRDDRRVLAEHEATCVAQHVAYTKLSLPSARSTSRATSGACQ